MAGTIILSSSMGVTNGNFSSPAKTWGREVPQANLGQASGTFLVTQAAEVTLPMGAVSQRGWIRILNLDSANFIRWGFATGVYGGVIRAGEQIQLRIDVAQDVFLVADTQDVSIEYEVNSD